jgi:5'-nucleotidase
MLQAMHHEVPGGRLRTVAIAVAMAIPLSAGAAAESLTLIHVGDQESWLISAAGNSRSAVNPDNLGYYGGVDRLAGVIEHERLKAGGSVIAVNGGDAFLPAVWFKASTENPALSTAYMGGQDFYDARALRQIGFDSITYGNHEFDLGPDFAAAFTKASATPYLSANLDFSANGSFSGLVGSQVLPSTIVTTTGGNNVGIVGATTPLLPQISSPGNVVVKNYDPTATADANLFALGGLIQAEVNALRAAGANTVVLVSHLQNYQNEAKLVPMLSGVDVVVSAGGHELMSDAGDPTVRNNGVPEAPAISPYPQVLTGADGRKVLVATSSFGNRYVGVLELQLDDTGAVVRDTSWIPVLGTDTRMQVVSQGVIDGITDPAIKAAVDAKVATVFNESVAPVQDYIAGLNGVIIGTTEVPLNGARGSASGTPGSFLFGVRNAETNLGNLAADSLRFIGGTDIALQNGGGIRASIQAGSPTGGNITAADPLAVLPFTNLVVTVDDISPDQLKALLENGYSRVSPDGNADGRFPQISGMQVFYDSSRAAGDRVRSIMLDDGTMLLENGEAVAGAPSVSMSTIDFLARGGDGYDFAGLGLDFETPTISYLYSEALQAFIAADPADGGLGGVVLASLYPVENPFDFQGRQIDIAVAVPEPETWVLMFAGLGLIGFAVRRRRST